MSTSPAVVFRAVGDVALEEIAVPVAEPGELLMRTRKSLIGTSTELAVLAGEFPPDSAWSQFANFPMHAGYSNLGEVMAVGEGDTMADTQEADSCSN